MNNEDRKYRVTFVRPSRSKCPNAWVKVDGEDGWLGDEAILTHGSKIVMGGSVRRASHTERISDKYTIDEVGSWPAWGGTGSWTIEEVGS